MDATCLCFFPAQLSGKTCSKIGSHLFECLAKCLQNTDIDEKRTSKTRPDGRQRSAAHGAAIPLPRETTLMPVTIRHLA